jgi:signal transduction histidine kinase/phage shock protein PspC (stress-responsive transcriptional regulator)
MGEWSRTRTERSDVTTQAPQRAVIGTPHRPFRRGVENAIIGGVCGGLAIRLGIKERNVRIAFSLLALVSGIGVLLYMVLWLSLPRTNEREAIAQRLVGRHRQLYRIVIGLIAIIAIFFVLHSLGMPNLGVYTWPFFLSLLGVIGVWRGASPEELDHLERLIKSAPVIGVASSKSRRNVAFRLVVGAILIFFGLEILHHLGGAWGVATPALFGAFVVLGGVLVLLAPWWLSTLNDLTGEREARVRIEERANVAAHLHDSVLQTLTLIERAAGDEAAVVRLARNQERELRQWLFDPNYTEDGDFGSFVSMLRHLEDEIENDYGVRVELVVVGDCEANDALIALVAAGREAAINAARWSGAESISVYGEVESDAFSLFVRDQGRGFDVSAVPDDRRGITLSIRQRIAQHGGTAVLKSTAGVGTEVELFVPRTAP